MNSPYQFWIDFIKLLCDPKQFFWGLFELIVAWLITRNWLRMALCIPLVLVASYMYGSSLIVFWKGESQLASEYWKAIDTSVPQELSSSSVLDQGTQSDRESQTDQGSRANIAATAEKPNATTDLVSQESISNNVSQLLLKVLEIDSSSSRAIYLIASSIAQSGKIAQARMLMRNLAPENEKGYGPAHAWLAADRIRNLGISNEREKVALSFDLAEARKWSGHQPLLMVAYADLLIREQKIDDAIDVLREAGLKDSRLKVRLALLAKRSGRQPLFDSVKNDLSQSVMGRVDSGTASEQDFIDLITMHVIEQNDVEAIKLAQRGLQQFPSSAQLRRALSNSFMLAFEIASSKGDTGDNKIAILDKAMRADPANPAVMERIADLLSRGKLTDETFLSFLREQLASNKGTAVTHLLLAVGHLKQNELDKALVHLEVAHGLSPNNPIILNNLALCIARTKPEQIPQARKLIEMAIRVAGRDAEILDTYGEILALMSENSAAIRAFEAALAVNENRPSTRKKLADAYNRASMPEMANAVIQKGRELMRSTGRDADPNEKSSSDSSDSKEILPNQAAPSDKNDPIPASSALPNGLIKKDELLPKSK